MDEKKRASISKFLEPRSIAIIGASESEKSSYGRNCVRNLYENDWDGELYFVNPKCETIRGEKCYATIADIGHPVDVAIVIVNARFVEEVVKQCAECGVGACLIITAGFGEVDKVNGKAAEERMRKIAEESGMRIIGANTNGAANVKRHIWMTCDNNLNTSLMVKGLGYNRCAWVSQSGATGFGAFLNVAVDRNLLPKYIVTTGNETDLCVCDFVEYLLDDEEIDSIAVLSEGVKDGEQYLHMVDKARVLGKKLIFMKIGESAVGNRAAMSHTASMTGDMAVFNAMVKQYGAIKAENYSEMIEYTKITHEPYLLKGRNLCAVSSSGGVAGFLGDQLGKNGFSVPEFSEETQKYIDQFLKGFGSPRNPLDLTSHTYRSTTADILKYVEEHEPIDGFVFGIYSSPEGVELLLKAARNLKKPCYFVWIGSTQLKGLPILRESGFPVSFSIPQTAKMLSAVVQSSEVSHAMHILHQAEQNDFSGVTGYIDEVSAKAYLQKQGISIPQRYLATSESSCNSVGFDGPYVMKVVSPTILHKSDVGGVALNLKNAEELKAAYAQIMTAIASYHLDNEVRGVVVEKMCEDGLDVMLGIRKDPQLGHVLVLGLGGIYTELFKMVSIRLVPLTRNDVENMLDEIPGVHELLSGYRGQTGFDRKALIDTVCSIADWVATNRKQIELLEINPLRVMPNKGGVQALDCVMKLS